MRIAVAASALLHLALIVVTMIAWPGFTSAPPTDVPPSIPIELVTVEDETNIAAQVKKPEPEPEEPKPEPEPEEPEPPEPKPAPEPKPEPEPAEPEPAEPEPKPEPAPEPKPEPEPEEEEEESKPEPEKPEPPKEEPPPEPKPEPAKEEPREEPEEADPFNQMASVLKDKDPDKQQERVFHEEGDAKPAGEFNVEGVGRQDGMTVSTVDALKYQISPCWSVDAGAKNAGELAIGMVIEFNPDGTLRPGVNNPRIKNQMRYATDSYFRAAADRAVMAVRECEGDGYKIPPGLSKLNVTFDPSEMVGGG